MILCITQQIALSGLNESNKETVRRFFEGDSASVPASDIR